MLMSRSLLISYTGFFVGDTDAAPGYYLARNGYDVWAINLRGTEESIGHVDLNAYTDPEYWDITFESLVNDITASIELVRRTTNYQTIPVVCYNINCTPLFMGMSAQPEWFGDRMSILITLEPILILQFSDYISPVTQCINPAVFQTFRDMGVPYLSPPSGSLSDTVLDNNVLTLTMLMPYNYPMFNSLSFGEPINNNEFNALINMGAHLDLSYSLMFMEQVSQN